VIVDNNEHNSLNKLLSQHDVSAENSLIRPWLSPRGRKGRAGDPEV